MAYWDDVNKSLIQKPTSFEVKPWREIMTKALADAKAADRKRVEARIGKAPRHKAQPKVEDAPQVEDCDAPEPVVQSNSIFSNIAKELTMEHTTEAKPKKTQAEREAETQARIAKKEAAQAEKQAKKEAAAAAKREKLEAAEAKKAEREAAAAAKKAEKQAKLEAMKAEGKGYVGSMLSLTDRVKQGAYVKGLNGQLRSSDALAVALEACPPENVIKLALEALEFEINPYVALNTGQQSMNLRNKMRGAIKAGTLTIERVREIRDQHGYATMEAVLAERQAKKAERARIAAEKKAAAEAKRQQRALKVQADERIAAAA